MYKGDIPFCTKSGRPMYYPDNTYRWEYKGVSYNSWFEIEQKFDRKAVDESERITVPPDWRPNAPFRAVMTIDGFSRGRSAANFNVIDRHGTPYTVFLTDMLILLQTTTITKGKTELLTWSFCKRGQNYGVKIHG
jgi:hypothetical protein